ncbi:MAG: NAD(P)-dependent oxidoreductase [Candidatus Omnitrophota bacterium]
MRIGLMGTGLMGRPMAERLMEKGFPLAVYNRTQAKALPLADIGAEVCSSPSDVARSVECMIFMLSDYDAVSAVINACDPGDFSGKTVIQMSTILPEESRKLKALMRERGAEYMEAPVLGSRDVACKGELIIMVGAESVLFEKYEPVLKVFGPEPRLVGDVGQAAALKLALNQLIIALAAAFSFSLGLVQRSGVKVEDFMDILRNSALYSPAFDKKLPRMLSRDFSDPNFPVRHMLKDVNLILAAGQEAGLDNRIVAEIAECLKNGMEQGDEASDYSAVFNVINPG